MLVAPKAVASVAGLGLVAVQQHGRQSVRRGASALKEDLEARDHAKAAQIQAVLKSLQLELLSDRGWLLSDRDAFLVLQRALATPL